MTRNSLLPAVLMTALTGIVVAQNPETNPAHAPDVYLDNHRPLLNKKEKAPTARRVTGKVVDDTGQPLTGALVTLTNGKTGEKTTFITKNDGRYSFEDVDFTIDYQLQAKYKDQTSDTRKLSQYDHTVNVVRILEVGVPANPSEAAAVAKKDK